MPLVDGFVFLETVKSDESYRNVPVCMLTTSCNEETKNKLLTIGALDCVIKPRFASNYVTVLALILNKVPSFDEF